MQFSFWQQIKRYARPYRRRYAVGMVTLLLANGFSLSLPYLKGEGAALLVRHLRGTWDDPFGTGIRFHLFGLVALFLLACALKGIFQYYWRMYFVGISMRIARDVRREYFRKLLSLSPPFFDRMATGDLMSRATNDISAFHRMMGNGAFLLFDTLYYFLLIPPILFWIDWKLALVILGPLPLLAVFIRWGQRETRLRARRVNEQIGKISARVQESVSGMRVIKAYHLEENENREFRGLSDESYRRHMDAVRVEAVFRPAMTFFTGVEMVLVLIAGGYWIMTGTLAIEQFFKFIFFLEVLIWPLKGLGYVLLMIQQGKASFDRLNEVLQAESDVSGPGELAPSTFSPLPPGEGPGVRAETEERFDPFPKEKPAKLEIREANYQYPGTDRPVLRSVDLTVEPGQLVALIGAMGSGKTTLLHLIPRLYEPPRGTVFLDGIDVREIPPEILRQQISFVPQDPFLFSETIGRNVAYSDPLRILQQEIEYASGVAAFHDEVVQFPKGYEQLLGERGVNLSGGQRQRGTIARALAVKPRLLVFDDCFSSVDVETEHRILARFRKEFPNTSTLVVTHRAAVARMADVVYVLKDGRVVEHGRFRDLYRKKGELHHLLKHHALLEELQS